MHKSKEFESTFIEVNPDTTLYSPNMHYFKLPDPNKQITFLKPTTLLSNL